MTLFILIVQFLATYKSDLIGKGLETIVIIKIFVFAAVSLLVLALPVAVLLASLFAMGNFGENYELAAMRSAGMSVPRILRPMIMGTLVVTMFSMGMSAYIVPWANLKLYNILYDVSQMKPVFRLEPGHFNSGIDNYVIRITDKEVSTEMLYGVTIYDHTTSGQLQEPVRVYNRGTKEEFTVLQDSSAQNNRFVIADSGTMKIDPYGKFMNMMLYNGATYEAKMDQDKRGRPVERYVRVIFDSLYYSFDMTGFGMEQTEESAFSSHQYMLNLTQLTTAIDSIDDIIGDLTGQFQSALSVETRLDSTFLEEKEAFDVVPPDEVILLFPRRKRKRILQGAFSRVSKALQITEKAMEIIGEQDLKTKERGIEFHLRIALPMACLVFLFIGAPLGSIIRKGGAGIPILVSVSMYVVFSVLRIQGKKMATEGVLEPWVGAWLPVLVMLPLAIFLSLESVLPVQLLSGDNLWRFARATVRIIIVTNPLYWLYRIPPIEKAVNFVFGKIGALFGRKKEEKRSFRVRR